jgi:predicted ester cyclase
LYSGCLAATSDRSSTRSDDVAATGQVVEMRGMDIFEIDDGRVAGVWAIADWLALLSQAGTIALAGGESPTG